MILGLRTALYPTPDLPAGKHWYTQVLGVEPYYDSPTYVGYRVGGFEVGLVPDGVPGPGTGGVEAYWGVDDIDAELARLLGLGASALEPVHGVGEDIRVAAVVDPFGNRFSLIQWPGFDPSTLR